MTAARYLTADEIAARLGVSRATAYRLTKRMLRVEVSPGILRVPEAALNKFIRDRTKEPETWDASTAVARRGTRTGPTREDNSSADHSEPPTVTPRRRDSANSSWLRPIQPRTRPTR